MFRPGGSVTPLNFDPPRTVAEAFEALHMRGVMKDEAETVLKAEDVMTAGDYTLELEDYPGNLQKRSFRDCEEVLRVPKLT